MYSFVVLGLPDGTIGTAWPALRKGFGAPLDDLGIVLLVGTVGSVSSSSVAGLAFVRLGTRATVMLAGTAGALGALGMVLSPTFLVFVVSGALIGVAAGLLDSTMNTSVALTGRNRLLNMLHGSYGVGTTLAPLVVTAAVLAGSWRDSYVVVLGAELLLVGLWWAAGRAGPRLRRTPPEARWQGNGAGGDPPPADGGATSSGHTAPASGHTALPALGHTAPRGPGHTALPALGHTALPGPGPAGTAAGTAPSSATGKGGRLRLVLVVGLGLAVFMVYTGFEVSAGQWEPSFDRGELHLGAGATGLATFGYWGALTLARFGLALPRRPVPPVAVVRWGCLVALGGAAMVWWRPAPVVALIGLVVVGAALAGVFPALIALTPARVGEDVTHHVIGWQIGAAGVGGSAISAAFGLIFQRFGLGQLGLALVVVALALLAGIFVLEKV